MAWDQQTIVAQIRAASDQLGRVDQQRLRQWTEMLRRQPSEQVFAALYSIFTDRTRPEQRYLDQEYAGQLLWRVQPRCEMDLSALIRGVLSNYELSIEELPWYLGRLYGAPAVLEVLGELEQEGLSAVEQRSAKTFRYWLRVQEQDELSKLQPGQCSGSGAA